MIQRNSHPRPIRVGIFDTVEQAEDVVNGLRRAGFSRDEITVVCSDETKEKYFRAYEHEDPAGAHTATATIVGGTIGAVLVGTGVAVATAATGGLALPLFVIGPMAAAAGGVLGGLVGAMMTRGVEKEVADFYDQAVTEGRILVAAEVTDPEQSGRLIIAEHVLEEAGAAPVPLSEG